MPLHKVTSAKKALKQCRNEEYMITSSSNSQIKNLMKLQKQSKARNEQEVFVCEGKKMFEEVASQRRNLIQKVYLVESCYHQYAKQDPAYLKLSLIHI